MLFVIVIALSIAYGVGFGMVIAMWQMASEPCRHWTPPTPVVEEVELGTKITHATPQHA